MFSPVVNLNGDGLGDTWLQLGKSGSVLLFGVNDIDSGDYVHLGAGLSAGDDMAALLITAHQIA